MMKKKMMTNKMGGMPMMPQGYANGGKAKPFSGKDTASEERAEAKAVAAGRVSPAQYKAKEMVEEKREGEKSNPRALMSTGKAIASGRMSPDQYAAKAKMADGGYCTPYPEMAGNAPSMQGGQRSRQDFGK
jgi:hypothetical protein